MYAQEGRPRREAEDAQQSKRTIADSSTPTPAATDLRGLLTSPTDYLAMALWIVALLFILGFWYVVGLLCWAAFS
jgi:hypothetical protein